jgi:20S proteasome alpha/beta subunit
MCLGSRDRSTDKAVLAVNGFAADGNMFVKGVKQRLEASLTPPV